MVDNRKISFIVCVNNDTFMNECSYYIEKLFVPEGYVTEILEVRDAKSMTSGYQEAMLSSNAKYKIYMHQDVFLINRKMLFELLEIFKDPEIGMVGTLGGKILRNDISHSFWNKGSILNGIHNEVKTYYFGGVGKYEEVEAVDGMFMATQYDIDWDERFDCWHMYDLTQAVRFRKSGYKVCVSTSEFAWTFHESGYCSTSGYEDELRKFANFYPDYFAEYKGKLTKDDDCKENDINSKKRIYNEILTNEKKQYGYSNLEGMDLDEFWSIYLIVKFLLNRMEFGFPKEYWIQIKEIITKKQVTLDFIFSTINHSTRVPTFMANEMIRLFSDNPTAVFFDQYQRYHTIAEILRRCKKMSGYEKVTILEVGANNNLNLEKEDKEDVIYYSDLEVPENRKYDNRYFAADATNLFELNDNSYDYCISSDVLEHVPVEKRINFLSELYRVCREAVIICFPNNDLGVAEAEKAVSEMCLETWGESNKWLDEHRENGLPDKDGINSFLDEQGIEYKCISHGDINMWKKMQILCSFVDKENYRQLISEANFEYNKEVYSSDVGEVNYRSFYVLLKNRDDLHDIDIADIFSADSFGKELQVPEIDKAWNAVDSYIRAKIEGNQKT